MSLAWVIKGSRVELYKLHVLNCSLGTIYHSLTVACSDDRVGSGLIYSAATAGTHQRHLAQISVHFLCFGVQHVCTIAVDVWCAACHASSEVVLSDNLHGEVVLLDVDVRTIAHSLHQSALYFGTRIVGVVQNAEFRVSTLAVQVELAVFLAVEVDTPIHKFLYLFGRIAYYLFYGLAVADIVARNHSVLYVLVEIVDCEISY